MRVKQAFSNVSGGNFFGMLVDTDANSAISRSVGTFRWLCPV